MNLRLLRAGVIGSAAALVLSGCGFSPYKLPLPGGADVGDDPYTVKVHFRDVLDLVPQSAVRVDDIAVGKVTDIKLNGWTAVVTVEVNSKSKLPDNAEATIRQTSLLGEKFVSLAPPKTGARGQLGNGDTIPLERSSRNPEIEEVLGAASLLFNGGGLEKTNTIVKELNNALGGNEPEVKELIGSTTSFITQLDNNKAALLTSLEKINRLAIATNDQKAAITGALDDLPDALRVVNGQRDDLVKLLESLSRLSDVATDVIRDSKADTVANLRALVPTLTNLTKAGDDLAYAAKALLTYPFSDGFVGNTFAKASGKCQDADPAKGLPEIKEGVCFGDFANLDLGLDISATQLTNLLEGYAAQAGAGDIVKIPKSESGNADVAQGLVDLVTGLVPDSGAEGETPGGTGGAATPKPTATPTPSSGGICSLLGTCRTAVANEPAGDLERLLVESAVAR
ncbi:MCE family protein [Aeromicrobium sp. NPDC092404]|uniref:MCE family protein n=1 Tax=Aeromicrobium sp. NPDC092404 TaxID=3154976 RepID=UPI003429746A